MPRPLRRGLRIGLLVSLLTGCERVHYVSHEFAPVTIDLEGGIHASVAAYGAWQSRTSGDSTIQTRGTPFTIEVQLRGQLPAHYAVEVQFIDAVTSDTARVTQWSTSATDLADSSSVFAYRDGVDLRARTQVVRVLLRNTDTDVERSRVGNGLLQYSVTHSTRLRVLERARGL